MITPIHTDAATCTCRDPGASTSAMQAILTEAREWGILGIDLEWTRDGRITWIGLGTANRAVSFWRPTLSDEALKLVREAVADASLPKLIHNLQADKAVWEREMGPVGGTLEDTMLLHHAAYPGIAHDLQQVASQFLVIPPWKAWRRGEVKRELQAARERAKEEKKAARAAAHEERNRKKAEEKAAKKAAKQAAHEQAQAAKQAAKQAEREQKKAARQAKHDADNAQKKADAAARRAAKKAAKQAAKQAGQLPIPTVACAPPPSLTVTVSHAPVVPQADDDEDDACCVVCNDCESGVARARDGNWYCEEHFPGATS